MSTTDHRPGQDAPGEEPPFGDSVPPDELVDEVSDLGAGEGTHPIVLCVYECLTALESVREVSTLSLSAADLKTLIVALARIISQAMALNLRLLAAGEAKRVADTVGARSTAALLSRLTRTVRRKASSEVRLAKDLEYRYPIVAEAFAAGIVNHEQVVTIVKALRRLPRNIAAEKLTVGQRFLVDAAQAKNAEELGRLGKELWEILDPEGADKHLQKKLHDEEELARARAYFQSWRNGDGTTGFRGKLPDAQADALIKVIEAYAAPRRRSNPNINTPDPSATADSSGTDTPAPKRGDPGAGPDVDPPAPKRGDPGAGPDVDDPGDGPPDGPPDSPPDPNGEGDNDRGGGIGWNLPGFRATGSESQAGSPTHGRSPDDGSTPEERETGRGLPWTVILGHGLIDLVNHLPRSAIPQAGGVSASMVVTIDKQTLLSGIGAATLDTGTQISASQARKMACTCGIIPAVLGGPSQVLDLGHQQRAFTAAQHTAMAIRDGGCVAETCDVLPAWCEAHHKVPWALGGPTALGNGCLLCFYHHHLAHDDDWTINWLPNGQARFRRLRHRT